MSLARKIVLWMEEKIPSSVPFWFSYAFYREYKVRAKERNYTLTAQQEKEIRDFYNPYVKNVDLSCHKVYYNLTGTEDVRFIPDYLYYRYIDPYFCNYSITTAIENKNYYDKWFNGVFRLPETVARRMADEYYDRQYNLIDRESAIKLVEQHLQEQGELIAKPSLITGSGHGIRFIKKGDDISKIFDEYNHDDIIVQHVIKQHPKMAELHPESVNTIRIATMLYKGEASVLSAVVRIGVDNSRLDNSHQGGIAVGIDENGHLRQYGYDQHANRSEVHPQGFVFKNGIIPNYDKVVEKVLAVQKQFPHYKIINWDICIDEDGEPLFIEFNLAQGGIYVFQYCNGPVFGDRTEEILAEVFKNRR